MWIVFQKYRTEIELADFNVVEAPKAIRAFSVLSVAGLSSLVEGEGTNFQRDRRLLRQMVIYLGWKK